MLTEVYSWPLPYFIMLNVALIIGCIYTIIKEKDKKKLYLPIFYILIPGSIISVINKWVHDSESLIRYSKIVECLYYGYLVFFAISFITICIIGIKRTSDINLNRNKPMLYTGLGLFIFGVVGFLVLFLLIMIKR